MAPVSARVGESITLKFWVDVWSCRTFYVKVCSSFTEVVTLCMREAFQDLRWRSGYLILAPVLLTVGAVLRDCNRSGLQHLHVYLQLLGTRGLVGSFLSYNILVSIKT